MNYADVMYVDFCYFILLIFSGWYDAIVGGSA